MHFFATAAKGTEPALRDELRELAFRGVRADRGGVHFEGAWDEGYRACLWSRIALRVFTPVGSFDARNEREFYDSVRDIDLSLALGESQTLIVGASSRNSRISHTQYLSQLTKDAIVDRIRDRSGRRPSVDRRDPDVHVFVHLANDFATLYLDLAGEPLSRRGYRDPNAEAPLRETLAAAVVRYSGWDRKSPLCDPLCGSGTLLIEAALAAWNVAPGLARQRFGFERWAGFDAAGKARMAELRGNARALRRREAPAIFGSDASPEALEAARASAKRARVELELSLCALRDFELPDTLPPGTLVTNPPYGHRIQRSSTLPRELSELIDAHPDWRAALLLAEDDRSTRTHRRPDQVRQVFNGDIDCVVRVYAEKTLAGAERAGQQEGRKG